TLLFACESGKESQKSSDAIADEVVVTEEKLSTSKNDVKNTVNQTSTENSTSNAENTDSDKSSTLNKSSN
ncbi:MAG: hypothetical protein ACR2L5_01485, partial [Candidatus Actinomarinaceae bacterium]